jgi:hypothetical protein
MFGGVARGMSGSRRVSRLAVQPVFGSMMSNEIKSWKTILFPCLTHLAWLQLGPEKPHEGGLHESQECMTP